ncbi:MAG: metallophosphoesterase [Bacteroidota bacterium]
MSVGRAILRLLIFVLAVFGLEYYAFEAISTASSLVSENLRVVIHWIYWMIPVAVLVTLFYFFWNRGRNRQKKSFVYWRASLFAIYLFKLLLVPFMLIDDIRRIGLMLFSDVAPIERSLIIALIALVCAAIPFVLVVYGMLRNPFRYKIFREEIPLSKLPENLDGLRIVHISDFHAGSFMSRQPVTRIVELINSLDADLVFFTGDLVNSVASEFDGFREILDGIKAKYGIYSILGNHDYGDYVFWPEERMKRQNFEKLLDHHKTIGWDLLMNENRIIEINGKQLAIIGVENYSAKHHFPKYGNLAKAYTGTEAVPVKLLLSHDPSHWDEEINVRFPDIDITFSGHTHGFQFGIEIEGLIKWSPFKSMYKQWAGLYKKGTQFLYVNRGLGVLGYPGRVGMLPDISLLTLRKK